MSTACETLAYEPDDRLAEAIASFEEARDAGLNPDPGEWLRRYPDVAVKLVEFFAREERLRELASLVTEPTEDLPAQVGRFRVDGEITRTAMARIVRIRDEDFNNRPLAMKLPLFRRHDLEARLVCEAQTTGLLQHPGIPPVHAWGRLDDGQPYFVMKLIEGSTLRDLLEKRPSPATDLPHFVGLFEQICHTVGYAHSRQVIHRDLKPANVMVGAFGEVQVLDWGLAKMRGADAVESAEGPYTVCSPPFTVTTAEATAPGTVMGTRPYIAPEAARGEVESLDAQTDVFGLGAILCEILTGEPPFTGHNPLAKSKHGELAEATARLSSSGADAELVELARCCLAPRKEDRPADGAAVAAAVAAYQAELARRLRQAEIDRAAADARAHEERKLRTTEQARADEERRRRKAEEAKVWAERKRRRTSYLLTATLMLLVAGASAVVAWYQGLHVEGQRKQAIADAATRHTLDQAEQGHGELQATLREPGGVLGLLNQPSRWKASIDLARASLDQARATLASIEDRADPELAERAAQLGALLRRDDADRLLAVALEKIRMDRSAWVEGKFDYARAAKGYPRVFAEAGLPVARCSQTTSWRRRCTCSTTRPAKHL